MKFAQLFNSNKIPNLPDASADQGQIETILQIVFQVAAVVAVLIIVIAGFTYVLSGGDPQKTNRAKDAILYAVIGLVVAILGYTIVTLVINRVVT